MLSIRPGRGKVELMFSRFFFFLKTAGETIAGLTAWSLLRVARRRRQQVAFIRATLAAPPNEPENKRVIVALSTLPDRITRLEPVLRCLFEQTRPPDEILLAIPKFSLRLQKAYVIPSTLESIPRLRILRSENDWGPATKFIPALQHELAMGRPETLLMVVDDDRLYPRDALATYLHYHRQLPDAALCFRGGPMPRSLDWRESKLTFGNRIREPREVAVITGCGSYFLQPRFFDERLWDYASAPPGAFFMDDIWISGWLNRRGVKKFVVPTSAMMRTAARQLGTLTLHDIPGGRRQSNNETIRFFAESWRVFASR
jgi:hypothetical protein